jgi:hypothetical protein
MAIWIAILIHVVVVEFYVRAVVVHPSVTDHECSQIHKTEATNQVRLDYALEPLNTAEESSTSY